METSSAMVSIFRMAPDLSGIFHAEMVPLQKGKVYDDWIISRTNHYIEWERLRCGGMLNSLPKRFQDNYDKCPRGRVSFNMRTNLYTVYHGDWLKARHKGINPYVFQPTTRGRKV